MHIHSYVPTQAVLRTLRLATFDDTVPPALLTMQV